MARRRKIDTSGWEEEGRVERIDTHVASNVTHSGPETYRSAYEAAKKVLQAEQQKPESARKSLEDIRASLRRPEPQYEPHHPERSQEYNTHVTIRNDVTRHLWATHNQAVDDALAGKPPTYQSPSIRYA
jgi:flagellar basal body rod protein FlgC